VVSFGLPFLLVRLASRAALARATINRSVWARQLAGTAAQHHFLFTTDDDGHDVRARMFAPGGGVEEDPATGSAAAAFGGWAGRAGSRSRSTSRPARWSRSGSVVLPS
jgi:trans-2,3-dihydro-3-hydroxyanthranilate isomerase